MVLVACKINTQLKVPILSLQSAILRFRGGDTGGGKEKRGGQFASVKKKETFLRFMFNLINEEILNEMDSNGASVSKCIYTPPWNI